MRFAQSRDTGDARYDPVFLGVVVATDDPLGIGRVKVEVPGLLEPESKWAHPMFSMFGVKNGIHWVPEVGSSVCVFCHQGDHDYPYYLPGPFGAPQGNSDVPEQSQGGDPDVVVVRWHDFHFTLDGRSGQEKVTLEDLDSGTKLEIERASGDYLRDVEGSEVVNVAVNRDVTVETGDETHSVPVGKRTTTIQGDDARTVVTGDDLQTISAGNREVMLPIGSEVKTLTLGSSSETMPAGTKSITALAVSIVASGIASITAGGLLTLQGTGLSVSSGGGASSFASGGLATRSFLGGITDTVVGAVARGITGAWTLTVSGIAAILATTINLGLGPTFKAVLNEALIAAFNAHTHGGVTAGGATTGTPTTPITPGGTPPYDQDAMVSTNVNVS